MAIVLRRSESTVLCLVVLQGLLLGGCWRSPRPVRVRLGWQANANSVGQIAAAAKGFYREAGLDVRLLPGGLDVPSVTSVAAGQDDFGFANGPDLVINGRAAGVPLKIVAVIQQDSYHCFMVRESSSIRSPRDWAGRRVGIKRASPTFAIYHAILSQLKVDRSKIREIPVGFGLQPFLEEQIDVYPGAFTNEAISLEQLGLKLRIFKPAEYGIQTMGSVLFTTESMIDREPELVRNLVRETLRGWEWAIDPAHRDEAVRLLLVQSPQLSWEKEARALDLNRPLVQPTRAGARVGDIDLARLAAVIAWMHQYGNLRTDVRAEDLATEDFLP